MRMCYVNSYVFTIHDDLKQFINISKNKILELIGEA